jgi:DNA-binding ferritin-like protein
MNEVNLLLSILMQARNIAHRLHWRTKSFAQHMALGDLYEQLQEFTDEFAEIFMGITGETVDPNVELKSTFDKDNAVAFIGHLQLTLSDYKQNMPQDGALINKYEELQAVVAKAKYKLEKLN